MAKCCQLFTAPCSYSNKSETSLPRVYLPFDDPVPLNREGSVRRADELTLAGALREAHVRRSRTIAELEGQFAN
jgi:hypothetical protein